ncbi:hypothetical protein FB451DRAFT_1180305 [Mycena latifolia]|nr:hypothetical protein FB451DRAFT_1180305 [Mycena latifolia]
MPTKVVEGIIPRVYNEISTDAWHETQKQLSSQKASRVVRHLEQTSRSNQNIPAVEIGVGDPPTPEKLGTQIQTCEVEISRKKLGTGDSNQLAKFRRGVRIYSSEPPAKSKDLWGFGEDMEEFRVEMDLANSDKQS